MLPEVRHDDYIMLARINSFFKTHRLELLLLLAYTSLAMIFWFPLSIHLRTWLFDPNFGDSAFNMWILGWGSHALLHAPWRFFEAPMFYPYHHVLAWGDNLFAVTLVTLPLVPIIGLLAVYNLVLVGSSILCGFTLYVLVNYLTKNKPAAFLAGSIWMLSYARIVQAYIQILPLWWLPLIFLFAEKLRRGQYKKIPWFFPLVIFLQLTTGIYVAVYTVISFAIYAVVLGLFGLVNKSTWKKFATSWLIAGACAVPIYAPSILLNIRHPTVRSLNDQVALQWADLNPLHAPGALWHKLLLHLGLTPSPQQAQFSLGILLSLLVTIGVAYGIWRIWRAKKIDKGHALPLAFLVLGSFALIAALGPNITLFQGHHVRNWLFILPYTLVPGFKTMRLTLRWQFIALMSLAIFASFLVARLLRRWPIWLQVGLVSLAVIGIVIEQAPWGGLGKPAPPLASAPVYAWLSQQPGQFAVAELPIYAGVYYGPNDAIEGRRLYFQTLSGWHPRASGAFSPYIPGSYPVRAGIIDSLGDNNQAIAYLRQYNIKYVLVLPNDYVTLGWGATGGADEEKKLNSLPYLKKAFTSPNGVAYQVLPK